MSSICALAKSATNALNKTASAAVSVAALEQYAKIVELIKSKTCIDINEIFGIIALLAVLCWISAWIKEIVHFVCVTLPNFFKNLCQGKLSICVLDCHPSCTEESDQHH
jgi:uncharacterized protein with PQ loop repeat